MTFNRALWYKRFNSVKPMTPEENPYEIVDGQMVLKDRLTFEKFLVKVKEVHGNMYTYGKIKFTPKTKHKDKITITCSLHGDFTKTIGAHLSGAGCPMCTTSRGEQLVAQYLDDQDIEFVSQKTFEDCINPLTGYRLRYDFYLPDYNLLIEFDGQQHFEPCSFTGNKQTAIVEYESLKFRDRIKNEFAEAAGISLLRIPYTKINCIPSVIAQALTKFVG